MIIKYPWIPLQRYQILTFVLSFILPTFLNPIYIYFQFYDTFPFFVYFLPKIMLPPI